MPTSSQTLLRELLLRSGDIPVAGRKWVSTEMSSLPNLAGPAAAQLSGADGLIDLIDLIATNPFQHADLHAKEILGQFALPEGKKGRAFPDA